MDIGEKILELMKNKNIRNIKELSKRIDIPYTTLRAIVDGTIADIKINTAIKLCKAFNITLNDLFGDELDLSSVEIAAHQGLEDVDGLDISDIEEVNEIIKLKKKRKQNNK